MNKTNKVNDKIADLLAMGCLQPDDPQFEFFKQTIVPSVVNEFILPSGLNSHSYMCPFQSCGVLVSSSKVLERHLREKHYDEIPRGVFGIRNIFKCVPCGQTFKRHEHLTTHNEGRKHLKNMITQGIANNEQIQKWKDICKAKQEIKNLSMNGSHIKFELSNEQSDDSSISSNDSNNLMSSHSTTFSLFESSSQQWSLENFPSSSLLQISSSQISSTPKISQYDSRPTEFLQNNNSPLNTGAKQIETLGCASQTSDTNSDDALFNSFTFINLLNQLEGNERVNENNLDIDTIQQCNGNGQQMCKKRKREDANEDVHFVDLEDLLGTKRQKPLNLLEDEEDVNENSSETKTYFEL